MAVGSQQQPLHRHPQRLHQRPRPQNGRLNDGNRPRSSLPPRQLHPSRRKKVLADPQRSIPVQVATHTHDLQLYWDQVCTKTGVQLLQVPSHPHGKISRQELTLQHRQGIKIPKTCLLDTLGNPEVPSRQLLLQRPWPLHRASQSHPQLQLSHRLTMSWL